MIRKKKRRRSRETLEEHLDSIRKNGGDIDDLDLEWDEITDVLDLALEAATEGAEACQDEAEETIEVIKKISWPPKEDT